MVNLVQCCIMNHIVLKSPSFQTYKDGCTYDGLFKKKCEDFMTLLCENRRTLTVQLEIFIHNPPTNELELNARRMERINEKLSGYRVRS